MKPDSIRGLIAFLFFVIAPSCVSAQGDSFHLEYRDGTIVTVEFAEKQLSWTAVSDLGNMSKQLIDVSKIESLKLTLEPAGEQLATILKLIGQLDSDDFYVREESERDLRSIGKRFKSVMQRTNTLKTQDGIYRLKRVLSSLRGNPNDKSGIELDELYLKDGTRLAGDAGGSAFDMTFRGKSISVPRNQLIRLTRAKPISTTRTAQRELIDTKLFHNHADFMKDRDLKLIDFELKPNGVRLRNGVDLRPLDKNVSDDFVDVGLVLGTEYPKGCVGISGGFEVKGGDKPVGGTPSASRARRTFRKA